MNRLNYVWTALVASALLSGCGAISDEISSTTTTAGPKPLSPEYEELTLSALLDPDGKMKAANPVLWETAKEGQRIDLAFNAFHTLYPAATERERRDQVQERLLGISNQLCSRYQSYIQNIHSDGNFILGSLATIAGAAGAIFTGGTSQILAGTAGALSGVRAEFNQDYFSNLTVAVITSGINLKRQEIYDDIVRFGSERNERRYTVEAAVKDALFYHGECSLMAGVEKAGAAIKLAQDPGLDAVNKTLIKVNQLRKIAQEQVTDPSQVAGLNNNTVKLLQAGKPTGEFSDGEGIDTLPNMTIGRLKLQAAQLAVDTAARLNDLALDENDETTLRTAIKDTAADVDTKIGTCTAVADTTTAAIVAALGQQAAALDDTQRKIADRSLEAALFNGNAVSAKARIPVDIFNQKLSEAMSDLQDLDRKAREKSKATHISTGDAAKAKAKIEEAKIDFRCT